jgi:probable HAF family extracellular repeat protein
MQVLMVTVALSTLALGQDYIAAELAMPANGLFTQAVSINAKGNACGFISVPDPVLPTNVGDAAIWQANGSLRELGTFGQSAFCQGVNDNGDVVLSVQPITGGVPSGVLLTRKRIEILPIIPQAVNNKRQVVGSGLDQGNNRAFIWDRGEVTQLASLPGSGADLPLAINQSGEVVGYAGVENGTRGFLWTRGTVIEIGSLGGFTSDGSQLTRAIGLNDSGDVVGTSLIPGGTLSAFVWRRGKIRPLDKLEGTINCEATAINSRGDIVGSCSDAIFTYAVMWKDKKHPIDLSLSVPLHEKAGTTAGIAINDHGQILVERRLFNVFKDHRNFVLTPSGETK